MISLLNSIATHIIKPLFLTQKSRVSFATHIYHNPNNYQYKIFHNERRYRYLLFANINNNVFLKKEVIPPNHLDMTYNETIILNKESNESI
jgi:hypothetical protein